MVLAQEGGVGCATEALAVDWPGLEAVVYFAAVGNDIVAAFCKV